MYSNRDYRLGNNGLWYWDRNNYRKLKEDPMVDSSHTFYMDIGLYTKYPICPINHKPHRRTKKNWIYQTL